MLGAHVARARTHARAAGGGSAHGRDDALTFGLVFLLVGGLVVTLLRLVLLGFGVFLDLFFGLGFRRFCLLLGCVGGGVGLVLRLLCGLLCLVHRAGRGVAGAMSGTLRGGVNGGAQSNARSATLRVGRRVLRRSQPSSKSADLPCCLTCAVGHGADAEPALRGCR